jgi:glycine/D-amino acid oxidase-like deaminating enzyme
MASDRDETVVVGAGAIGLSTAYWLARAGVPVRVLDCGSVGAGASLANGGWVNRSDALPLTAPGVARFALSKLGRVDSPIYVQPRDLRQLAWLLRFGLRCRRGPYSRGAAALTNLGRPAVERYEELVRDGVDFEFKRAGHLHVFVDPRRMKGTLAAAALLREFGYDGRHEVLDAQEAHALEPALSARVRSAVLFPNEGHVVPEEFVRALATRLGQLGVPIQTGVRVRALESAGTGRVTGCLTDQGRVAAARIVLAAGVGTRELARTVGADVPIRAGKGYSFTLTLPSPIRHTMLLGESKVGLTPLGGRTRVLGTMEFSDDRPVVRPRRIAAMLAAVRGYLDGVPVDVTADRVDDAWVGLRPMSVDGLPIVDRLPSRPNAFVATGHGMLGLMLGPATGQALAQFIATGRRPPVLEPFRADRFGRHALAGLLGVR